jgi:NTE family protein
VSETSLRSVVPGASRHAVERFSATPGRPWLVLGGGGLKGLAHVGAWRALVEAEVRPAGIVGTSIGALIGTLLGSGMSADELETLALKLDRTDITRVNRRAVWVNGIRQLSVFRGDVLKDYIDRLLPVRGWDALQLPVVVNAVDLADGSTEWFGPGARVDVPMADAVYASAALPVLFPPLEIGGRVFVDGGTAQPLALDRATAAGATRIIGIDVGSGENGDVTAILDEGMISVHQRVFSIMTWRRRQDLLRQWQGPPLLYVRPRLDGFGTFDFDSIEYFLAEGYRAMRESLESAGLAAPGEAAAAAGRADADAAEQAGAAG